MTRSGTPGRPPPHIRPMTDATDDGDESSTDRPDLPAEPPDHLAHVEVAYESKRSGSEQTRTATVRDVRQDGDETIIEMREDGDDGRKRRLYVKYDDTGGIVWTQTRKQQTRLGPLLRLADAGEHTDLCPACGEPYEERKPRSDDRPPMYVHESKINDSGPMAFRSLEEVCHADE
jgi:hypothetical protein